MPWLKWRHHWWRIHIPPDQIDAYRREHFLTAIGVFRVIGTSIALFLISTHLWWPPGSPIAQPVAISLLVAFSFHRNAYRFWQPLAAAAMCWVTFDWSIPAIQLLAVGAQGGSASGEALSLGTRLTAALCWYAVWTLFLVKLRFWWGIFSVSVSILGAIALFFHLQPALFMLMVKQGAFANFCLFVLGCEAAADFLEQAQRGRFLRGELLALEHRRSEDLLLNILPGPIAERLRANPGTIADSFTEVTVMFADIVGFTPLAARSTPEATVTILNRIFSRFDHLSNARGLEKIKTIGDAYMVVGGVPLELPDHAGAMMGLALEMQSEMEAFTREFGESLRLRIGISTGPIVAGVIGTKKFIYDLWGDTVNMASRMESHGIPDGIQVTERSHELLRNRWNFAACDIEVKGRGKMTVYRFEGMQPSL